MKQFSRFPRWVRGLLLAVFVATCVFINAIAFTEIARSIQVRRFFSASAPTPTAIQPSAKAGSAAPTKVSISPEATLEEASAKLHGGLPDATGAIATAQAPAPSASTEPLEPKYGHFPYAEDKFENMILVASYAAGEAQRNETLHPDAAMALLKMISAARADGVWLVAASGFRTIAQQRTLFMDQIAAKGSPESAALVSAPPGYSEHHTGYAVDLADGSLAQDDDISMSFVKAPAYGWLLANAAEFGYELSFPSGNAQGISFEPWHWRFVGSAAAQAVFAPAKAASS